MNAITTKTIPIFAILLLLSVGFAAADTNVNITISEVVHQNVTYAENFNLVENRTYALIEGAVNVTNPSNVTVNDVYVRFDNIENLITGFIYNSGRTGYQSIYPDTVTSNNSYTTGQINSTFYDLGIDIDEDGTNDSVSVNDTHIIFNVTSEYQTLAYAFYNGSTNDLDISSTPVPLDMDVNVTSVREDTEYNENVTFANFTLAGTVTSAGVLELGSEVNLTLTDSNRSYAIVHIPELRSGQSTRFIYNISAISVDPPLDINTSYTNPEYSTKVLAGEYFGIQLKAANIATVGSLELVNITLDAEEVNVTNGSSSEIFDFTLHNLSDNVSISDDYQYVDNSSNRTWYWTVNNGTIPVGNSYNISFQIRAPDTVSSSATYLAMTSYLRYRIETTASELFVSDVRARAQVDFSETKRIVSPQDNESNNNVTWESIPTVDAAENITYTLEKVSLWVTEVRDPNQQSGNLETEYTPNTDINLSTSWTGAAWYFNFTDGSSEANPPPIVWVKPYWIIKNANNQIVNSSYTVNGTDLYMNYIYVVNGYWLEVDKQVLDVGDGLYDIKINVTNRGNGYTPQNLTVTVYDFIPEAFSASNFSPSFDNSSNVTGQFTGTAYQWDVGLRTNLSTSFSPSGSADGLDMFYVNYSVNGTGDFQVSDLYIVGLDPRLVDGAALSNEAVAVISAIATTSREVVYLAVVVFLIGINVANFMMTSRINKKLDR